MSAPSGAWSLEYADGSANAYRIKGDGDGARFKYLPVTPERSSTGMYSGGAPRDAHLDAAQTAGLWRRVGALEAATHLQTADRMKGTGAFHVTDAGGTRAFIILRGPELLAFDELVQAF